MGLLVMILIMTLKAEVLILKKQMTKALCNIQGEPPVIAFNNTFIKELKLEEDY